MKRFCQIILILIVISSLFITRGDFISVLENISSSFNKNIKNPIIELTKKEETLPGKVDTPGPLRVINNLLTTKNSDVRLSKDNIILLTNKYRKENGNLKALTENQKLNLSAEKKLQDMFNNQYFEHKSLDGKGVEDLAESVNYKYILIGENLAMGNFKNDESLLNAWVESKGHRENIVNSHYTQIGVAVGKGKFEGKDIWMAVQHFGTPISICPVVDQVLYEKIILDQNKLNEMETDLTLRREMINKRVVYEGNTHNEQISIYNNLVTYYNDLIKETKQKIDNYNEQIRVFNLCLLSNQ